MKTDKTLIMTLVWVLTSSCASLPRQKEIENTYIDNDEIKMIWKGRWIIF
jgi:hypothetical protein